MAMPIGLQAPARSQIAGLRILPAASVWLWEDTREPPEHEPTDAPPASATDDGVPPDDGLDLRSRLRYVLQPPLGLCLSPTGVVEWPYELMPFQVQGVRLLFERDGLLLADEMGLGKTIQALAALRLLALRGEVRCCLIVTPASVLTQWRDRFEEWAPELRLAVVRGSPAERDGWWRVPAHAHLVGYETLRADLALARGREWDVVIVDEAQRIKSAGAEVAAAVKALPRRRSWALTGTPLENRLADVTSILEFVQPGPAPSDGPLREHLAAVQLRRRKAEVLPELPPKLESDLLLPMDPAQRTAYERAEREGLVQLRTQGPAVRITSVLELIVRLKQLCNFDPATGASAKLRDLSERLTALRESGERSLVFTQFTDATYGAEAIASRLAPHRPLVLTGSLALDERRRVIERFRSDPRHEVLVVSLRAGGVGLDLQDASYVFHFDRWWNPAVEDQATDRSHRIGQQRPVHVYTYVLDGTVEERTVEVLREKRLLFDEVVEGTGIHVEGTLSREDLLRVAGLR
ncbi:MAG TPA: DEAD/DEAH box helicase [Candidatus Dormibacteraeota bacterium]|nr:DEAD/DEAH box helicase [Candidatus Dormibacteraeota bacterium]